MFAEFLRAQALNSGFVPGFCSELEGIVTGIKGLFLMVFENQPDLQCVA
jgi:hypothetical protein